MTRCDSFKLVALLPILCAAACGGSQPAPATAYGPPPAAPPPAVTAAPAPSTPPGASAAPVPTAPEPVSRAPYGTVDGQEVYLYTLTNPNGLVLKATNYGTIVTELHVPDRNGKLGDIVAGYENLDGYLKSTPYFGATVGRVANRIKNAVFWLDGKKYTLYANNGPHHLHGGKKGWDKVVWTAEPGGTRENPAVTFTYVSKDGEEGYPGTVTAHVTYTLTHDNAFRVDMSATTDKKTIVNMAHHSYFNLGGNGSGTIRDHVLTIHGSRYTPGKRTRPGTDPVPDGTVKPVRGTPFDFTSPKPIGQDLEAAGGTPVGYDHNWIIDGDPHALRPVATVEDPKSGRVLTLEANQPGLQFYAGIFLDGTLTGKGATYHQYDAFCLETQAFVNAINVPAWKDQVILEPGQTYQHTMIFHFSTH